MEVSLNLSSLNSPVTSPDESIPISAAEISEALVKSLQKTGARKPLEHASKKKKVEKEVLSDDYYSLSDDYFSESDEENDPIYDARDYEQYEPIKKPEGKRKPLKSNKQQGKEKRKGDYSKRLEKSGKRGEKYEFSNIS